MTTAIDSSVLFSIAKYETDGAAWLETLGEFRAEGRLTVCEVVWAETRAMFTSPEAHAAFLERLGGYFDPADASVATLTGEIHDRYRRAGGKRARRVADFLIGAHAALRANRLATKDDGFFREHFRRLAIVRPKLN